MVLAVQSKRGAELKTPTLLARPPPQPRCDCESPPASPTGCWELPDAEALCLAQSLFSSCDERTGVPPALSQEDAWLSAALWPVESLDLVRGGWDRSGARAWRRPGAKRWLDALSAFSRRPLVAHLFVCTTPGVAAARLPV